MHFRRAVAEQCTCSCWPSGSRRSVFLAFDDITLGESQPCLEFTREAPVQEATTLDFTLGAWTFTTRLQATVLSPTTLSTPSVSGCLVRLLRPAIFHRFRLQQCTRPLTDMKATTPIFQSAHLHSSPFKTPSLLDKCSSVPSLVTSRRAAPLFQ